MARDLVKQKERHKRYYQDHKASVKASSRINLKKQVAVLRKYVNLAKTKPCIDCNNSFPPYVMDFDHVRGDKDLPVSQCISRGWSLERVQKEIDKCDLVCANCHRIRTFKGPKGARYHKEWTKDCPQKRLTQESLG